MELTEFITARLDEDEAVARAAADLDRRFPGDGGWRPAGLEDPWPEEEAHVLRHAPARVLATVEAHRKIVSLFAPTLDDEMRAAAGEYDETAFRGDRALRALASIWSDHEAYDPAWEA